MAEEKKTTRFNNKRLSRKIIPISVSLILFAALIAFVSKYGVDSKTPAQIKREAEKKAAIERSIEESKNPSEEKVKAELEAQTKQIQDEKIAKEAAEKAKREKEEKERLEREKLAYPSGGLTEEQVNNYENRKITANRLRFNDKGMVAYERFGKTNPIKMLTDTVNPNELTGVPSDGRADQQEQQKIEQASAPESDDPNTKFQKTQDSQIKPAVLPATPNSKYMVMEATTIQTVLMTAINSQLPNSIVARVTQDVYDSIRGEYLLIPAGSLVKGTYNSSVIEGQDRVFISFNRLIFPSGASVSLNQTPGSDAQGRGGVAGNVLTEFWTALGSSFLIAAVGSFADQNQPNNISNFGGGQGINTSAGQILAESARRNMERFARYRPKITVDAGEKLTIIVSRDMQLDPYETFREPK